MAQTQKCLSYRRPYFYHPLTGVCATFARDLPSQYIPKSLPIHVENPGPGRWQTRHLILWANKSAAWASLETKSIDSELTWGQHTLVAIYIYIYIKNWQFLHRPSWKQQQTEMGRTVEVRPFDGSAIHIFRKTVGRCVAETCFRQ